MISDPKTFCFNFDQPKDVDEDLKHKIEFILKSNESLAENKIRNNLRMETIFMNMENSKANEPHYFVLNLSQRLD